MSSSAIPPGQHCQPQIILVSSYPQAAYAAAALSGSPVLIIDCEGENLGHPDGCLTILSIGAAGGSHIFLVDVLALPDGNNPYLRPLLALLANDYVLKVFWDGRTDVLELGLTYGVRVAGVLDLQVAEVVQRSARQSNERRLEYLANKSFKPIRDDVLANPAVFDGIYNLIGLEKCLGLRGLVTGQAKDPEVVEMHRSHGSTMWRLRPLHPKLVHYAAHDIELIGILYDHFVRLGGVGKQGTLDKLKRQSARYVSVYRTRELKELHHVQELGRFMNMGVLDEPAPGEVHYRCQRCLLDLPLNCFVKLSGERAMINGPALQRWAFCRLCAAIAHKNGEPDEGCWVGV